MVDAGFAVTATAGIVLNHNFELPLPGVDPPGPGSVKGNPIVIAHDTFDQILGSSAAWLWFRESGR